ncbi:hypothetical protein DYBT9623_05074 [Dyadobacter sp. CECT 9623]|uniref:Uncharacterized protein n=1 Tax=Dyadobacter linearis TaxID=2823330 RepID=A0ABN7RJJ0_9BACT|nr:hypothetical protein DYBT9623_05074 [Dyadobacter sp. CECT 9623]
MPYLNRALLNISETIQYGTQWISFTEIETHEQHISKFTLGYLLFISTL